MPSVPPIYVAGIVELDFGVVLVSTAALVVKVHVTKRLAAQGLVRLVIVSIQ